MPSLVGRRDEVKQLGDLLEATRAGAGGRIVEVTGEAGIGKSTLLAAVADIARGSGWNVWATGPTSAESALPWTSLAQLLDEVADLGHDAADRFRHLASVMSADRTEPLASELVAFALTDLINTASSARGPLLIVVDDIQWVDAQSAGALAFALRGTPGRRSVALLARRTDEMSPIDAGRIVPPAAFNRLHLGGLSVAGLREVVTSATGATLNRAELVQLHGCTGGNPLYAVEVLRARPAGAGWDPASLPESLRDSVGARIERLPETTRRILAAAALTATPSVDVLAVAFADLDVLDELAPAEVAGVIEPLRVGRFGRSANVRFTHPVLATAAVDALTGSARRATHLALATAAGNRIERAMHYVESAIPLDASTVVELAEVADDAFRSGSLDVAVTLAGAACTADSGREADPLALQRCRMWLTYAVESGRFTEASDALARLSSLVGAAQRRTHPSPELSEFHEVCAVEEVRLLAHTGNLQAARAAAERALDSVRDSERRLIVHMCMVRLALHLDITDGVELAERVFGPGPENSGDTVDGALMLAIARAVAGDPFDADKAIALLDAADTAAEGRIASLLIEPLVWSDHPDTEKIAERGLRYDVATGKRAAYLGDLHQLTNHLLVRGEWDAVDENLRVLGEYGEEFVDYLDSWAMRAVVLAARGNAEGAASMLDETAAEMAATASESVPTRMSVDKEAAIVAHTLGHPDAADRLLEVEREFAAAGIRSVRGPHFRRDLVEALVAAGRLDEASGAAERLSVDAEHSAVASALADADAAAGVLAAARGDDDGSRLLFDRAIGVQRDHRLGYELARTLLAAGAAARRAGRRRDARELLDESAALFRGMAAAAWVRRCEAELERLGRPVAAERDGLTAAERQIAELVADGLSNTEVANELFVSVRTVESHLTRVYRKLGIRSRSGLARALGQRVG